MRPDVDRVGDEEEQNRAVGPRPAENAGSRVFVARSPTRSPFPHAPEAGSVPLTRIRRGASALARTSRTTIGGGVSPVGGSARSRDRGILLAMAIARDVAIPVVDPYGSVFRLLRSVELPFSLIPLEDPSEIEAG